jgi:formylglycine-generating enzyme required for sulfatase activity
MEARPMIRLAITILALAMQPLAATSPATAADGKSGDVTNRPSTEATRTPRNFSDCLDCPEMVEIPAGDFIMGSPPDEPPVRLRDQMSNESPQRRVTIAKPFAAGRFEVTFAEWDACIADKGCTHSPSDNGGGRGRRPVVNVSWNDITREYIPWLSRKTGKTYRLLTEAEWEYAARAGTTTPHSTGSSLSGAQANSDPNSSYFGRKAREQHSVDVGSFQPNAFGLYDVHGNVEEWVEDCYQNNYIGAPNDGSAVILSGTREQILSGGATITVSACAMRVSRGGSWRFHPMYLRSAMRNANIPETRSNHIGVRLARTLD